MAQRFRNRKIGVVKLDILAHERDVYLTVTAADALDKLLPFGEIGLFGFDTELFAYDVGNI